MSKLIPRAGALGVQTIEEDSARDAAGPLEGAELLAQALPEHIEVSQTPPTSSSRRMATR